MTEYHSNMIVLGMSVLTFALILGCAGIVRAIGYLTSAVQSLDRTLNKEPDVTYNEEGRTYDTID